MKGAYKMTTKKDQYETRKWQILNIALDQFIQYGYYGTSTRKIAEEAGISSGLMFHYFPNKQALYEALVEIGCEKMSIDDEEGSLPIESLEGLVEWFLTLMKQNDFSAKMFVFMGLVAVISERAAKLMRENDIIEKGAELIIKGQELGEIRSGEPMALSATFFSCIQGIAETLVVRKNMVIPEKDWIMDIIRVK